MTTLHDAIDTTPTTRRRRRLPRVFAIGALAAGTVVALAAPAQAAVTGYHVATSAGGRAHVVSDTSDPGAGSVTALSGGTSLTIDCGVRGAAVHGDTVWHHITSPVTGYIADYYTDTPGFSRFFRGEAQCSALAAPAAGTTMPAAATPTATRGATIDYNEGYGGSCVYYAMVRFHGFTGVYPKAFGDAKYLARSAAGNGWTVSGVPRVNSLVVFQPGQNGAGATTGHVAWVEQISGDRIYIAEMNAPQAWTVSHRWLTPAEGVRYVYAA